MLYAFSNKPASKVSGYSLASISPQELDKLCLLWGKQGESKTALVLRAISSFQGITTDNVRAFAKCSNVPNLVDSINKKILSKGLFVLRTSPVGVAPNAAFHHWYLLEVPITSCPVQMSVNDPIY